MFKNINNQYSYTFIVNLVGIVIGFFVSIYIARNLGVVNLGIFNLATQISGLILVLSLFGVPISLMKNMSIAIGLKRYLRANLILKSSNLLVLMLSIGLVLISIPFIDFVSVRIFNEPLLKFPLLIALLSVIPLNLSSNYASAINAYNKNWQSLFFKSTLRLVLIVIMLFALEVVGLAINLKNVVIVYGLARLFLFIISYLYFNKIRIGKIVSKTTIKPIFYMAFPFFVLQAVRVVYSSTDSLMLGSLLSAKDVGLYGIAFRLADLSNSILIVVGTVVSPRILYYFANNKILEIEKLLQVTTKYLALFGLVGFIIVLFFGNKILLIWGQDFVEAYWLLVVLYAGQFFNFIFGLSVLLLTLCGEEKLWSKIMLYFTVLNIFLNYVLITLFGNIGAAISTALLLMITNCAAYYFVNERFSIKIFKFV